jgi:acyl-CoA synthetase (AMP-forming)/AMP-acid ligase II
VNDLTHLPDPVGATLVDCARHWATHRADAPAYSFATFDGDEPTLSTLDFRAVDRKARAFAVALRELAGLGDRVALLLEPGLGYVTAFLGCLYAGVVAVPLYPPTPMMPADRFDAVLADADVACVVASGTSLAAVDDWLDTAPADITRTVLCVADADDAAADDWTRPDITADTIAFLQYTSGSTRTPSGVLVSHGNLALNCRQIGGRAQVDADTTIVSWLPVFHDMGLIFGVAAPVVLGVRMAGMTPMSFLMRPVRWLKLLTMVRGNIAAAPNFAYDLCVTRVTDTQKSTLDLSGWHSAISGAEPVRARSMRQFADAFAECGFAPAAFAPGYGLAEATLCVSGQARSERGTIAVLSRAALADGRVVDSPAGVADAIEVPSCGSPMAGQTVRIVDPETLVAMPEGGTGEVWVSGANIAGGYWGRPESVASVFQARLAPDDGRTYLRTGDVGFLREGQVHVIGRLKDLVIIDGRNHYPPDVEATVEQAHPAIRKGAVVAFGTDDGGQERLAVAVEVTPATRSGVGPDALVADIEAAVRAAVAAHHEIRVHDVVALPRNAVPKTSSGKVRRAQFKAAYQAGTLPARIGGPAVAHA